MNVERHGCHRERRPGGDGSAIEVADLKIFGADPAGELIAPAHDERNGSRLNVGGIGGGLDADGGMIGVFCLLVRGGFAADRFPFRPGVEGGGGGYKGHGGQQGEEESHASILCVCFVGAIRESRADFGIRPNATRMIWLLGFYVARDLFAGGEPDSGFGLHIGDQLVEVLHRRAVTRHVRMKG